jgi:hypothetical protein
MNSTKSSNDRDFALALVATTDRPAPFAALAEDLVRVAVRAPLPLSLGLVENSRLARSRALNAETVMRLRAGGVDVVVSEAAPGGLAIGDARMRQRELLRDLMLGGRCPSWVWMLDDDLRLARLFVEAGVLVEAPLTDPLGALTDLARQPGRPEVVVGMVHGDPPIPAMATWASRVGDLLESLAQMTALGPESAWWADTRTIHALCEPDFYYDYGSHPTQEESALWLPRGAGESTATALCKLLAEARHLPDGVALTRPVVWHHEGPSDAADRSVRLLGQARVRGGNTVFFDPEACLEHEYPALVVEGVTTRRADSVGLALLEQCRGRRTATSDFALLHGRDRDPGARPDMDQLVRHLTGDTLGAALSRAVAGSDAEGVAAFLRDRVARIDRALVRLRLGLGRLRAWSTQAPGWVRDAGLDVLVTGPDSTLAWFERSVPGLAAGRLPDPVRGTLLDNTVAHDLVDFACICRGTMTVGRTTWR